MYSLFLSLKWWLLVLISHPIVFNTSFFCGDFYLFSLYPTSFPTILSWLYPPYINVLSNVQTLVTISLHSTYLFLSASLIFSLPTCLVSLSVFLYLPTWLLASPHLLWCLPQIIFFIFIFILLTNYFNTTVASHRGWLHHFCDNILFYTSRKKFTQLLYFLLC